MANRRERAKASRVDSLKVDGGVAEVRELLSNHLPPPLDFCGKQISITGFGACEHVGRSCFLLKLGRANILLDCGVSLIGDRYPKLPDGIATEIDLIVLSHAHLDHCGYIPWLYRNGCSATILATEASFMMMNLLCRDSIKLNHGELFERSDLNEALKAGCAVKYGQRVKIGPNAYITLIPASHMIGSAQVLIEFQGRKILYSGDIALGDSALFSGAKIPEDIDTVILDSTYGQTEIRNRAEEVSAFLAAVENTVRAGGTVIIPSFASSRAQEVLLTLSQSTVIGGRTNIPVHVDGLILPTNKIYRAYENSPENNFGSAFQERAPWALSSNGFFKTPKDDDAREMLRVDTSPKVIVTTSGMVEGLASLYLETRISDPKHLLCFVGYQTPGSTGHEIQQRPAEVMLPATFDRGPVVCKLNIQMMTTRFSGHSTANQICSHLNGRKIENIHLVHGEPESIEALSASLLDESCGVRVNPLRLCEEVRL